MLGKIERLKSEMELQLDDDIFDMDVVTFYSYYGIYGVRHYSWLRLACFFNHYKINKYVFDEFHPGEMVDVMRMLHNVWLNESNRVKNAQYKRYAEVLSDICFGYYECIFYGYKYYRKLNELYKHILTKIKGCKTLPNKTYTTKERRN